MSAHDILVWVAESADEHTSQGVEIGSAGWVWCCSCGCGEVGFASERAADDAADRHEGLVA